MRKLTLKRLPGKRGLKFSYQIIQDGHVLCTRNSNREYVACYVRKLGPAYDAPYFFSRMELVGKSGSAGFDKTVGCYGLAVLDPVDAANQESLQSLQTFNDALKKHINS